jgi:hypothetical protein
MTQILAATKWNTNAELIADVARMGYLPRDAAVFDPTFGGGHWWDVYRPRYLTTNDVNPKSPAEFHEDFTRTSWESGEFDVIAYDPPYVSTGGRKTSTIPAFNQRYGIGGKSPSTPAQLQVLINDGLIEMRRLLVPKGTLIVKSMSYVSGGKLWDGEQQTEHFARSIGFKQVERLVHLGDPGPQPAFNLDGSRRKQAHARANYTVMFVFKRP